jgi:heat shock protein HslJ
MTRFTLASLATLCLLASVAGAATVATAAEPMTMAGLEGPTWQLHELAVDGALQTVPDDVIATLHMADGGVGGSGGCNAYFGDYVIDGDALTFGPIGSTQMFCEGPPGEIEAAFFANLLLVASWASDGMTVTMSDADGNAVLTFAAALEPPMPADGIEGLTWLLQEQAVDGTLTAPPEGVIVSLILEGGSAGGSGGCNAYFASYELDGSAVSFSEIGSTMMFCEGAPGEVEAAYFTNLALVASWASDGFALTLSDADGNAILTFQPAPAVSIVGSWVALGINNGNEAVVTSEITAEVTATFGAEGDLTGNDGCNDYFTTYEVDGEAIAISDAIGSTRMACASDELAEQSAQYFAALVAATAWSTNVTGALELRDDSGALQVSFLPAE